MLLRIGEDYKPEGLKLVLVSMDPPKLAADTEAQFEKWTAPAPWFVRRGSDSDFIEAWDPNWSGTLPATWLMRRGKIVKFWEGEVDEAQLLAAVQSQLQR